MTMLLTGTGGGAGVAAFAPTDIAGLYQWYAARKESGFSDNDAVGTAVNFATGATNATQGTAGAKPTFKTGIKNGQPVFRFDGDDSLGFDSYAMTSGTVFFVAKVSATGAYGILGEAAGFGGILYFDNRAYWADSGGFAEIIYGQDTNWHIVVYQKNDTTFRLRIDTAETTETATVAAGTMNLVSFGRRGAGQFVTGDIPEILVYRNTILTAPQIVQVETYLNEIYAAF